MIFYTFRLRLVECEPSLFYIADLTRKIKSISVSSSRSFEIFKVKMVTEALDDVIARHRKESKELQSKIMSLKKSIPKGDKKKKKQITEEIALMEAEFNARQDKELKEAESNKNNNIDNEDLISSTSNLSLNDDKSPYNVSNKGPSKQRLRLEKKKAELEKGRKEAELEAASMVNHKEIENKNINEKLIPLNLGIEIITADGHCLYNSISDQLKIRKNIDKDYKELREIAGTYMRNNSDDFIPFVFLEEDNTFDDYCNKVINTATWGGQLEIVAISKSLKIPINVVQADTPLVKIGDEFEGSPLYLSYHRHAYGLGEHYNSLKDI